MQVKGNITDREVEVASRQRLLQCHSGFAHLPQDIISKQESILKRCCFTNNVEQPVIGDDNECVNIFSESLNAIMCLQPATSIDTAGAQKAATLLSCDLTPNLRVCMLAYAPGGHVVYPQT